MSLSREQKDAFDHLNKYSYMFRLQIERSKLAITMKRINGCEAYFVMYKNHVIGVVSFGEQFVNFSLYKYIRKLFPKLDDFRMSEYYDSDMTRFLFDKYDTYMGTLKDALDTLPAVSSIHDTNDVQESIDDVKARLMEFLVSDDTNDAFLDGDSLPVNVLRHDISMTLAEISRLENEKAQKNEDLIGLFLRI